MTLKLGVRASGFARGTTWKSSLPHMNFTALVDPRCDPVLRPSRSPRTTLPPCYSRHRRVIRAPLCGCRDRSTGMPLDLLAVQGPTEDLGPSGGVSVRAYLDLTASSPTMLRI